MKMMIEYHLNLMKVKKYYQHLAEKLKYNLLIQILEEKVFFIIKKVCNQLINNQQKKKRLIKKILLRMILK